MTNHSTSTPRSEPFDPDDYLISDESLWQGIIEGSNASFCMSVPRRVMDRTTGEYYANPVRCKMYNHQPCAERRIRSRLRRMHEVLQLRSDAYIACQPTSEISDGLISGRRYAKEKKLDRPVWCLRIDRTDGTSWFFASEELGGRPGKEPSTFHVVEDPLRHIAHAMRLPGVTKVLPSHNLVVKSDQGSDDIVSFGFIKDPGWSFVNSEAARLARERYGLRVNPLAPTELDDGLPPGVWEDLLWEGIDLRRRKFDRPTS